MLDDAVDAGPVRLDRFPVTVGRYKRFLDAVEHDGSARWDHPEMPAGYTHQPWRERLRIPSYYDDPAYENHPAIAINWWSAYAFARFEGKRLPTSLEWEAAARGTDGRLFPWGDEMDVSAVNCADAWSDHPLITYEAWREELDRGRLAEACPGPSISTRRMCRRSASARWLRGRSNPPCRPNSPRGHPGPECRPAGRWEMWVFSPWLVGCHPVKAAGAIHQCFPAVGGDDGNDCPTWVGRLACYTPGNCI